MFLQIDGIDEYGSEAQILFVVKFSKAYGSSYICPEFRETSSKEQ